MNHSRCHPISIAILAGGRNIRFDGQPKATIIWEGEPLISKYIRLLQPFTDNLFIITNTPELFSDFSIPCHTDLIISKGPLSGIHAALHHAKEGHVLALACDMPFLPWQYIPEIVAESARHPDKIIVPAHHGGWEPLFSLWPQTTGCLLEAWLLQSGDRKIRSFIGQHHLQSDLYLGDDPKVARHFFNVNTPGDLAMARKIILDDQEGQ